MNSKNVISEKTLNLKHSKGTLESKGKHHQTKDEKLPNQNGINQSKTVKNYTPEKFANEGVSNKGSVVDKIQNKTKETQYVTTEHYEKNRTTNEYKPKEENNEEEYVKHNKPVEKKAFNKNETTVMSSFKKGIENGNGRYESYNKKTESSQDFTKKNSTLPDDISDKSTLDSTQLMTMFMDGLKDIYWAEKALTKFIPKMVKQTTSTELVNALSDHLNETETHIKTIEQVFDIVVQKATEVKCEAMEGLMKEAMENIESYEEATMRDIAILSAAHKIEHYEIASYNTLRYFAENLGIPEADILLDDVLNEELNADRKLFELTGSLIRVESEDLVETE